MIEITKSQELSYFPLVLRFWPLGYSFRFSGIHVKDVRSRSGVTWNKVELLRSERELTTKVGEQSWPQLVCCASICCRMCGCIFQEDGIVVRSAGVEWYID